MTKSQIQKFRDAARAVEADESEERFDNALRRVAKSRSEPSPKEAENQKPKD